MQRLLAVLTLAGGLALTATAAHADTFTFSLTGTGGNAGTGFFSGSGTLTAALDTATGAPSGAYLISGVSGTDVTGFIGPGLFDGDDDLIYPSSTDFLDTSGFAFTDQNTTGVYTVDIYETSGSYFANVLDGDNVLTTGVPVSFSIAPTAVTPEPSSILLLATGLLATMFLLRRRPVPLRF